MVGLLNPMKYGDHFYELSTRRKLQNDRKSASKRKNKDKKSAAIAAAAAVLEGNAGAIVNPMDPPIVKDQYQLFFPAFPVSHIELEPNASKFAVFSAIRATVLEAETRFALFHEGGALAAAAVKKWSSTNASCCLICASTCMVSNLIDCSCHSVLAAGANHLEKRLRNDSANSDADSDSEEGSEREPVMATVPLIVGAGLRSLFELIADARHIQPVLCTKALKALLDVIQGQQPESFKLEPDEIINPLYDLLLELATMTTALLSTAGAEDNWSATACGALIGLCIARGDTGKMLKAIAAMLMSPKQLSTQIIQLPSVLTALQRTVISAVLNKPTRPDFHSHGVPFNSLLDEFPLKLSPVSASSLLMQATMACDGTFIYLLYGGALIKIGTGFGGTYKGHIYAQNDEFTKERNVWLGYSNGLLYFRRNTKRNADHLQLVNTDTLVAKGLNTVNMLPIREGFNYVLFTDDESLNAICTNRDDTLVVKKLSLGHNYNNEPPPFELPLQLARKKFRTLGYAAFEEEVLNQNQIQKIQSSYNIFEPKLSGDLDVQTIACGKEFGIVRASNGKVYYYGKSGSLGLKLIGRTPIMKLTELIISKVANIVHIAVGHDGIHALLVNDDGTVYFAGTSRRGEDGDTSKNRRSPKAVKPKKMSKIDGHVIVHAACNNGTSAFVTKTGKLIMFGKDTAHCDSMGFVSDFIEQHITKVALGKAHCVALNAKGQLFTFGLNNKGQCGRVFNKSAKEPMSSSSSSTTAQAAPSVSATTLVPLNSGVGIAGGNDIVCDKSKRIKFDFSTLCDYDDHNLVQGQCRVCVVCRECTGYNVSCVSALNVPHEERVAGSICPCGHGDAGCAKCGLCAACISVQETENDTKDSKQLQSELHRPRSKTLIMRRREKKPIEDSNTNMDFDKDPPRVAPLGPQLLSLPTNSPVVQVSCGLHHTVVLTLAGEVFTFGSNQYGQLGTGDLQPVNGPVKVHVQGAISQVAAGSNHTVLMTHKGMVYTFGNYQRGQLGRLPNDFSHKVTIAGDEENKTPTTKVGVDVGMPCGSKDSSAAANLLSQRQKFLWNCTPGAVFGLGPSFGKKVTWIGASGDQTFIKIDESLITAQMLPKMHVVANKKTILLIPTIPLSFHTLSINRRDGSCTAHYRNQVNFVQIIQNNKANALPEINQNIDVTPVAEGPSVVATPSAVAAAAGTAGPINEQMSRSMHEARNQIFDVHLQDQHVDHQQQLQQQPPHPPQQRRRQRRQAEPTASAAAAAAAAAVATSGSAAVLIEKPQPQIAFAMDPLYNVLWVFDGAAKKLRCHNVLNSEINDCGVNSANYRALLSPELSLPNKCDEHISRSQASLNLLACLDILTSAQDNIPACFEEILPKQPSQTIEAQNNEYQVVNRFDNFGGGWGYSGHSVEAVRFSADTDVMIVGFGIFGGRGEYTCKVRLYDMGPDGGGYEKEGVLVSETKEIPFECAARSKHHVLLPKPINAAAGRWYLVWARVSGPSSDCGSCGQASITTEDQVVFTFKSSKKANNGTDVNSGQIPAILYRLISQESKQPPAPIDAEPVQKISKAFANSVTKECFESLVVLLSWSWESFKTNIRDQRDKTRQLQVKQSLEYLIYVNKSCLRLLRKYTNEIYPQRSSLAVANNSAAATNIVAALSKLHTQSKLSAVPSSSSSSKNSLHEGGKDKNAKTVVSSAANSLIASNVAKYFGEAAANAGATVGASTSSSMPIARKPNLENIQLAECIGNVRALLIGIFCDDIFKDISTDEGYAMVLEILDECHLSFVACFDAFYPTSSLKWNCLCDLLAQMDKGAKHSRLLSAILAGLCSPSVKLRSTFSLLNAGNERQSIISPSDNSGLPMLSSTEAHQYPILVEQMIYRTQQEKNDFLGNSWTFKDVLVQLLEIIANPIRAKIEQIYNRTVSFNYASSYGCKDINQGLIDNCCHLLARVLAEIVYQTSLGEYDKMFMPPRTIHSSGSRFARCDLSRTWNTGNFGPDAIAFSVDRAGIAIAGAMVYSGSGSYDYQLELLYDNTGDLQPQHKWETLESISGSYDQDVVHNDMTEIKFEHPVYIKENARYALRLCSQGARTCSGDAGIPSVRGPCGATFHFYSCDLSFNGTTPQRGQIPCILYYSTPIKNDVVASGSGGGGSSGGVATGGAGVSGTLSAAEVSTRDTALQIASDITKKCTELLILARNALAASSSPSDNSSNHTQTIDSEHNITPIEEHMDINWANNSRTSALPVDPNISTARDITKRIESFSKGIMETLKFDKRSTNPFEMEIEIGATEIGIEETPAVHDLNFRNGQIAKLNGNERAEDGVAEEFLHAQQQHQQAVLTRSDSEEAVPSGQLTLVQILEVFNLSSSNMFHTLLPLVYAHIANLACSDPKSSVQILGLIKEILPHIAALNQLYVTKDQSISVTVLAQGMRQLAMDFLPRKLETQQSNQAQNQTQPVNDNCTTSNHYCIVESEHPYRSASISCYRVEFPPCVQWLTIEFDAQCGTAQLEDYLLLSIPTRPTIVEPCQSNDDYYDMLDNNVSLRRAGAGANCRNAQVTMTSCYKTNAKANVLPECNERDWIVVKKFNTASNWMQNVLILPGNCVEFSLETSSLYAQDPHNNRYGFKCLVVGYDNPTALHASNSCLIRLEQELAYLGGMCSANLMKKDLNLPDDKDIDDMTGIEETISTHHTLLSKGFALAEPTLTVHQALESYLPIGSQSNERQFLKDFISGAPGSSGARLAAWLQPESRLDPNKCELNTITEPLRYGWPTQVTVTIRDQYGDAVLVPELKVEIKAIPTGPSSNGNIKMRRASCTDNTFFGGVVPPPRLNYEQTTKEKMCFKAITFMKPYTNYSFEELRYSSPVQTRITETLYAQDMEDGTFSVHWTPNSVGSYCLTVTIDSIPLEEVYRVEVKEGVLPPPSHKYTVKKPQAPNKLRKFLARNSAGLRIRSHPTMQSEQVGIIDLNGVISFVDEIENDDGIWLRLSTESIRQHCTIGWYPTEAWCLQYNQHLAKALLHPVTEAAGNTSATTASAASTASIGVGAVTGAKVRHKVLMDNVDAPPISPSPNSLEASPSKPKSASPSKKIFDFTHAARFTPPPKSSDSVQSAASTNPFLFPNVDAKSDLEVSCSADENELKKVFDCSGPTTTVHAELLSLHTLQNTSPSNIGSAIAGVVGGGASKLQALQKWFKGDTIDGSSPPTPASPREGHQRKRSDVSEIASVSVRELVRVMGGQETQPRSNGNSGHQHQQQQQQQQQRTSPMQIPPTRAVDSSTLSASMKSVEASESTTGIFSSLTQDSSQHSTKSLKQELHIEHGSQTADFDIASIRKTNFTPSQTAALLSTPKHTPRRLGAGGMRRANSPTSSSIEAMKESDISTLEDDMSLLQITTTTTTGPVGNSEQNELIFSDPKTGSTTASTDNSSPPVWPAPLTAAGPFCQKIQSTISSSNGAVAAAAASASASASAAPTTKGNTSGPIKRAMPPSFAESIRAVFAAFLWHEGIVHDAMACASFLKFHPSLPKEGATVITRRDSSDARLQLSREQKAQQRHSVEVANAGNYLNIRPSTLETLTKSGNSSLNNRSKYRKNLLSDASSGGGGSSDAATDKQKLHALPEVVTVLPPALRCLVYLWEQICANCVQIVQSNTLEREKPSSPTSRDATSADAKEKNSDAAAAADKDAGKKTKRKKKDDGSWCEICEVFLPIPVTYHMRIAHPGCGKSAKGKGYNSVGIFCEGWAGNCGEGGKGASSWFLMCDACRDRYLSTNKNTNNVNSAPNVSSVANEMNLFGVKTTTLIANSEVYTTMRENATFLLELSSSVSNLPSGLTGAAAGTSSLGGASVLLNTSGSKRSPQQMPVVIEHQHFNIADLNKPSTSRADSARNSRIGLRMSGKFSGAAPYRKSFVGVPTATPDNFWLAADTFACLECLGTTTQEDMPYEMFGVNTNENGCERPLSEISYESCDPNNYDMNVSTSAANQAGGNSGTLSKFHRSFSMGQGWAAAQQQQPVVNYKVYAAGAAAQSGMATGVANAIDESQHPKVIFRRRNNSTSEGDGSLLICYPSENLRRLVPEKILASAVVHAAVQRVAAEATVMGGMSDFNKSQAHGNANDQHQHHYQKQPLSDFEQAMYTGQSKDQSGQMVSPGVQELNASHLSLLLSRPSMAFITQKHDLEKLRYAMKRSLRIAACRIYSLQALNWLIRAVTQSVCLHDLMWWFVSSLSVTSIEMIDGKYEDVEPALEHPVSYTQISGRFSHLITQSLHVFLQSVADLTLHLPLGSPLQRIAIQCFGIRFRQSDHQFLHSSHVFGNISKILSKSDEQNDAMAVSTMMATTTVSDYANVTGIGSGISGTNAHCDAEHNFSNMTPAGMVVGTGPNTVGGGVGAGAKIIYYTDLNGMFEVTVSSRQAMAESLTDNSTETFWESDEEDRNKCKVIEISMNKLSYAVKFVLVHIDNSRDIQNKVLNVVFYAGQSLGDTNLIKSVDVDQKTCAWISTKISDESYTHFRLEFHGPENTLRVRQIKLLGLPSTLNAAAYDEQFADQFGIAVNAAGINPLGVGGYGHHKSNMKLAHATRIQQQICEAETLRVFRLITGQVFGKLISTGGGDIGGGNETNRHGGLEDSRHQQSSMLGMDSSVNSMLADSLDLREHMVGILFSRSKLSHLQKQVIVHIVHAIKKEAQRAKEDWDIVNLANVFKDTSTSAGNAAATAISGASAAGSGSSAGETKSESSSERFRAPDTYCFEMLSMVLALSGSVVGRSYLSHQYGLLKDLLSLLHTGSDRVQRQVTALLRRILPEISPESFAELLGVQKLPPADYNIAHQSANDFDMNRLGLLDIFLAVIAKSLQLQVKVKANKTNTEKMPAFLRLCNSLDLSVHLLRHRKCVEEPIAVASTYGNDVSVADPFRFDQAEELHTVDYGLGRSTLKSNKRESKKNLNQRWFLNGVISMKQAESIINLIRDLASGKLSEKWSQITKAAIAESVLNLTRLDEVFRTPENCIKTATLWLALASLCVLDRDHVEKLSSGQWSKVSDTRPMCTNHDDGETAAIIQCETCGSLCGDCDRFLHLNRKTRTHKRTVCKEEEEAIRVELHESCGRTKLFWLLALADSKTLKAMVEFRDGSHTIISGPQEAVGRCRFCGITGNSGLLEIGNVCADAQCQDYAASSCMKTKQCGHACGGVANEKKCLPCLQNLCVPRENEIAEELHEPKLTQDADDMCMICFEVLSCAPAIHLECGHVFHYHCSRAVLEKRWSGPRITFGFSLCPVCKADIQHPLLTTILEPINALKQDVKRKALMRIKYEGVVKETDTNDVTQIAMDRYAYYVCFKCQKAYYGGEARCDAEIGDKYDPEELVCGGCSDVARAQMCPKHGTDFLEYKCRYCCSVAVFFCFGTTHFCDTCHDDFQRLTNIPKNKLPQCPAGPKAKQLLGDECPLHVMHPPTGEEFALGCGVCRNAQTF